MAPGSTAGHRQRLKDRFARGEDVSRTDEALLELLLCYAIPQKDVQPLAHKLITEFGSLSGALSVELDALCQVSGIQQKVRAAYEAGLKEVLLPIDNLEEAQSPPAYILEALQITPVQTIGEVLKHALTESRME